VSQQGPAGSSTPPGQLLNVLGLAFGLAGSVGGTIGAGILRTPGLVAAQLPSSAWILTVWLLGGIYALMGASCISELAACFPRAGGWYVYAEAALGRRIAWVVGLCDWLAHCIGLAWVATTLGDYLATGFNLDARMSAIAALLLFAAIQLLGVKMGSISQELLSAAKSLVFIALVVGCFLLHPATSLQAPLSVNTPVRPGLMALVLAMQAVITTYDGWASPMYFAEEFSDPPRDLPRSLIGGVLAVMVLYLLINGALLHVLSVGLLSQESLPAANAAILVFGANGGWVITVIAVVALLGLINTVVMAAPRILYGLGRDGLLPSLASQVNAGGTPIAGLLITVVVSSLFILGGTFDRLLSIGAFFYVALPLIGLAALMMLRTKAPELHRPFYCWGYPVVPIALSIVSAGFLVGCVLSDPINSLIATALMGLIVLTALTISVPVEQHS